MTTRWDSEPSFTSSKLAAGGGIQSMQVPPVHPVDTVRLKGFHGYREMVGAELAVGSQRAGLVLATLAIP